MGFAGPRVIEQTIGQKLPKGFQRAEFLVEHGFVDRILPREEAKEVLAEILRMAWEACGRYGIGRWRFDEEFCAGRKREGTAERRDCGRKA